MGERWRRDLIARLLFHNGVYKIWGRTGFDLDSYAKLQAEDDSGPLKNSIKNIYANDNVDMAPSVAEADAILAKYGWAEEAALVA